MIAVWCFRFDCELLLLAVVCGCRSGVDADCLLGSFGLCFVFVCLW